MDLSVERNIARESIFHALQTQCRCQCQCHYHQMKLPSCFLRPVRRIFPFSFSRSVHREPPSRPSPARINTYNVMPLHHAPASVEMAQQQWRSRIVNRRKVMMDIPHDSVRRPPRLVSISSSCRHSSIKYGGLRVLIRIGPSLS